LELKKNHFYLCCIKRE